MAPTNRQVDRRLQQIYDRLPRLACKGLPECVDVCNAIEMSVRERERIEQRTGRRLEYVPERDACSMLDEHGRCTIYEIRPLICRLWGIMETMPCPHGCRPEGGLIAAKRGQALFAEVDRVGGRPPDRPEKMQRENQRLAEVRSKRKPS